MKSALLFAAGACVGAVAVLVAEALRSGGSAVLPVERPVADRTAGADEGRDGTPPPVASAAARDDTLAAAMRELVRKVDELAARAPERAVAPPGAGFDEEALARAVRRELDRRDGERFATLRDGELLGEVNRLCRAEPPDRIGARRAVDALLARELSPALRAQAMTLLGSLQRHGGQLAESVATLQRVVDEQGLASREGSEAAYQLVWTFNEQKNQAAALDLAGRAGREPRAAQETQFAARWAVAVVAANTGDVDQARREFGQIAMRTFGDRQLAWIVEDCQRRLAALR